MRSSQDVNSEHFMMSSPLLVVDKVRSWKKVVEKIAGTQTARDYRKNSATLEGSTAENLE
jgi:hypothetical protein